MPATCTLHTSTSLGTFSFLIMWTKRLTGLYDTEIYVTVTGILLSLTNLPSLLSAFTSSRCRLLRQITQSLLMRRTPWFRTLVGTCVNRGLSDVTTGLRQSGCYSYLGTYQSCHGANLTIVALVTKMAHVCMVTTSTLVQQLSWLLKLPWLPLLPRWPTFTWLLQVPWYNSCHGY
jgi:hypothetical protein